MDRPPSPRAQNAAVLLPFVGLFLLLPPFITLFTGPLQVFGMPLLVVYLFGVWIALVVAAALLSSRLKSTRWRPSGIPASGMPAQGEGGPGGPNGSEA